LRLTQQEIYHISNLSAHYFPGALVYLFGSRVKDSLKGGDIDLYIKTKSSDALSKKIKFLAALKDKIGEQKIDVLINNGSELKAIFNEAETTGKLIMNKYQVNLESVLSECEKHTKRINIASATLQKIMPLDNEKYQGLDDITIAIIDQFLFRFSKLQDAIGKRLFNNILLFLGEDIKPLSAIDRLNRLEQLNLLKSKNIWQDLREMRNNLAHEYEQEDKKLIAFLNIIWLQKEALIGFYKDIDDAYQKR